jgi:hypothetical protein
MTVTEYLQLRDEAEMLPSGIHRDKLLEQLEPWGPNKQGRAHSNDSAFGLRLGADPFASRVSAETGTPLVPAKTQTAQLTAPMAEVPTPEPMEPKPPSEQECVTRLANGDPDCVDIVVRLYGWERFAITRKLVVLLPPGDQRFFVLPVERGFVMGAFDETLATILFDHVPGQLRYVCERPCMVDRTGFAVERLKDADYWRTRELTRGTLV